MAELTVRTFESIADIAEAQWESLRLGDARATPFTRWRWLEALEASGCASPEAGWTPHHLTVWRKGTLVAAAPAYFKDDSDGDFARDWEWASAATRARARYFPKLCITVPFTPVSGRRLLVAQGEDRGPLVKLLVQAALDATEQQQGGAVQVLYCLEDELDELAAAGLSRRVDHQYHWLNAGYKTPEDFLARFNSKHRNMLKRERAAAVAKQNISIRTVRGDEIGKDPVKWGKTVHLLHRTTVDKLMWGRRWMNEKFYTRVFPAMPEAFEVVEAQRDGKLVAGAFNVADGARLFGRYWGCLEDHPFLHFNVCYYHSIDECIYRGVQVFEGGAGGEHKVARGFEPCETFGAHGFLDARLSRALQAHLAREWSQRTEAIERWREASPLFKKPVPAPQKAGPKTGGDAA
jgi:hypothetical protein